jgi:hypothetical protein
VQTVTVEASGDGAVHKDISIDQIREVGRSVSLRPFEGRCRAIIIDPADAMNDRPEPSSRRWRNRRRTWSSADRLVRNAAGPIHRAASDWTKPLPWPRERR